MELYWVMTMMFYLDPADTGEKYTLLKLFSFACDHHEIKVLYLETRFIWKEALTNRAQYAKNPWKKSRSVC